MKITLLYILLTNLTTPHHYEKFFEIEGGPEYMYYFSKFTIGNPAVEQSAIIDTGSDQLAFPCDQCRSNDCGTHQDPRFFTGKSSSFKFDLHCNSKIYYHNNNVCQFIKSYAEGSSLLGFLADDYMKFKNSRTVVDPKLSKFNKNLNKDLKLKAEFGCTTKETGLFKTQYADGILGLDNDSSFITSMEDSASTKKKKLTFSFGLCFHSSGGIMSVDLRNKHHKDEKITMMTTSVSNLHKPIIFKYNTRESYYEIPINHFIVGNRLVQVPRINMMVDSGTTFTHFPTSYLKKLLSALNNYCKTHQHSCGRIENAYFEEDTCLELKQPDDHYKNIDSLLNSFPDIKIFVDGSKRPYILRPKNYFYKEFSEEGDSSVERICMALKGQEDGKIILGAFSMIDYYFYFDRKERVLKIFKEDCYLRTRMLLKKKERLLEALLPLFLRNDGFFKGYVKGMGAFAVFLVFFFVFKIFRIKFGKKKKGEEEKLVKDN